jgi:hypothetical protein
MRQIQKSLNKNPRSSTLHRLKVGGEIFICGALQLCAFLQRASWLRASLRASLVYALQLCVSFLLAY